MEALLEAGADKEAKDKYGRTALMRASTNGHTEIVRYSLESREPRAASR